MVTAVVNVASAVSGQVTGAAAASGQGAASAGNGAGRDDSEFAQLLDGMDGEAAAPAAPAAAAVAKKAATEATTATTDGGLSAEMLAMCAIPMAPPPTTAAIPALIADSSGQQVGDEISATASSIKTAANTMLAGSPADTAVNVGSSDAVSNASNKVGGVSAQDVQWLQSGKQAEARTTTQAGLQANDQADALAAPQKNTEVTAQSNIQSGIQVNAQLANQADAADAKTVRQTTNAKAAATSAAVASDAAEPPTAIKPSHQDLYQQLVAQTAPMVAITTGQRFEKDSDATKTDAATASVAGVAVSNVATQAGGTQLATDAQAIDSAARHQLRSVVGSHQWATELGNKLTMLASKDTQSATLHMSPADLGPVQVRIDMNQNQASVWFTAEHAETRSALEQSLPRLREMFASQGMSLTDAGVFGDRSRQQASYSSPEQGNSSTLRFAGDEASETMSSVRGISLSLLDAYA